MIRKNPNGDLPIIHENAYVDLTAIICGKVIIEENVYVGPYAVIRADETDENGHIEPIIIHANSNIQDGVVIHSKGGARVEVGFDSSVAHRSIVHGPCIVGDNCFIGFNTVLFNCKIGNRAVIRHNSVVDGCDIPEEFYIPSTSHIQSADDLKSIEKITPQVSEFSEDVLRANHQLVQGYKKLQNEF